jgi:HEAT repeat protein
LPESLADGCTSSLVSSQYKIAPCFGDVSARRHDDDTATAALVDCLDDHDQDVRIAAVEALAGRNDPSADAALMNCLGAYSDKCGKPP